MLISYNPQRLTCPHCGGFKHIRTILSGNTFGAKGWSDGRWYYSMLQEPSPYQKCPHCGHYYLYEEAHPTQVPMQTPDPLFAAFDSTVHLLFDSPDAPPVQPMIDSGIQKYEDALRQEASDNGFGELNWEELIEAREDILSRSTTVEQKEQYLLTYIHEYNDARTGRIDEGSVVIFEEEHQLFKEYAEELIALREEPHTIQAEMCRELGQFERAIGICHRLLDAGTDVEAVRQILAHAEAKDSDVFELYFEEEE